MDITNDLVRELRRQRSPIQELWRIFNDTKNNWSSDVLNFEKAYFLSCLSELSYLVKIDEEQKETARYKLFPSAFLKYLYGRNIEFNFIDLVASLDINCFYFEVRGFLFVVYRFRQYNIIAVRGTNFVSLKDWSINLNSMKDRQKDGVSYHLGFSTEALEVFDRVIIELDQRNCLASSTYFTGHSMGGAVACILSSMFREGKYKVRLPYVFGTPRYGNLNAVQKIRPYSFVMECDLVPSLPPKWMGFADAGLETTMLGVENPSGYGFLKKMKFVGRLVARKIAFWEPHSIEKYRHSLGVKIGSPIDENIYVSIFRKLSV